MARNREKDRIRDQCAHCVLSSYCRSCYLSRKKVLRVKGSVGSMSAVTGSLALRMSEILSSLYVFGA